MNADELETADDDAAIGRYLVRVRKAARQLPPGRREWIIGRVGERIAEAMESGADDGDVAAVLAGIGEPEAVVLTMDSHIPGGEAGWIEVAAVVLLVGGGIAFLPAWVAGAVLLWASPRWQLSDRLLGTLVWPGGLAAFKFVASAPSPLHPFQRGWYSYAPLTSRIYDPLAAPHRLALTWLILAVLGIALALVAIRLLRRARQP